MTRRDGGAFQTRRRHRDTGHLRRLPRSPRLRSLTGTTPCRHNTTSSTTAIVQSIVGRDRGNEDSNQYGEIIRSPLSQARKSISQVMSTSWTTIPHVTDCNDADITELETLRRSFADPDHRGSTHHEPGLRDTSRLPGPRQIPDPQLDTRRELRRDHLPPIRQHRHRSRYAKGTGGPCDPQCRSNGCRRNRGSSPGHLGQREKRQLRDRGHTRRHLYDLECRSHGTHTLLRLRSSPPDRSPALPLGEPARCHGSSMTKSPRLILL